MSFGRDLRAALFHRVGTFSAREVQQFGAPVADHPRHQRRAAGADAGADGLHHRGLRADHDGRRRDHGAARGLRARLDPRRRGAGAVPHASGSWSAGWCRTSARCRRASTRSTGSCASRSPASAWCARSSASRTRPQRFGQANDDLTDVAVRAGRWMATMFPLVMLVVNVSSVAVHLVRRPPRRQRPDAGRRADRVPVLPDADPDVGDDGDLHADDGAALLGLR